ncbi:MAG: hypothetical protein LBT04_00065 [Prevotellaceae bacterium]|jgi:hypothetical protein|nr:hypothetical protein [Prevotellaceae bacterium]
MLKKIICFLLIVLFIQSAYGQKFIYKIDNLTYFDNRVFYSPYSPTKLFFGNRLTPLVGLSLTDKEKAEHRLYAGITFLQPFGAEWESYKFLPTIYYQYERYEWKLRFGTVPYREMLMSLPSYVRRGSAEYSQPNMQGGLLQYKGKKGYVEFLADWRELKTNQKRDNFGVILDGKYTSTLGCGHSKHKYMYYLGGVAQWDRLGNSVLVKYNVCDNLLINPFVGADFANGTVFKTLSLELGYILGYQNDRLNINKQITNALVAEASIQWKMLGLKNTFYVSDNNLMALYQDYALLFIGTPDFQSKLYNVASFSVDLLKGSVFSLKATAAFHYVIDYKLGFQQKITASVKL